MLRRLNCVVIGALAVDPRRMPLKADASAVRASNHPAVTAPSA